MMFDTIFIKVSCYPIKRKKPWWKCNAKEVWRTDSHLAKRIRISEKELRRRIYIAGQVLQGTIPIK